MYQIKFKKKFFLMLETFQRNIWKIFNYKYSNFGVLEKVLRKVNEESEAILKNIKGSFSHTWVNKNFIDVCKSKVINDFNRISENILKTFLGNSKKIFRQISQKYFG